MDELLKEDEVSKIAPKLKEIMESVMSKEDTKGITLVANASVGDSWGELKDL